MTSTYEDRTLLAVDVAIKAPCRAATTAAITLSGLQTVDGIVLAANDRVLVKNQGSGSANGIYLASTGAWTRTTDFDGNRDAVDGTLVLIRSGTANALGLFELSCSTSPANIGTTSLTFNLVSVVIGNAGVFTTISASGQVTSSIVTGTAPLVIASTTKVANLNVDLLDGTDWRAPGAIGSVTPAAGSFTTLSATGTITSGGLIDASGASSGQVKFPATQNPSADRHTFDNYDEFTWTPSLGGTATYTTQLGNYTTSGNMVAFTGTIVVNVIGSGSTTVISGLPFSSAAGFSNVFSARVAANSATAIVSCHAANGGGTSTMTIVSRTAANAGDGTSAIFQNGTQVVVTGVYLR